MIKYSETRRGDILRVLATGELARVLDVYQEGVLVEDKHGQRTRYLFNCGASQLEPTEWKDDFAAEKTEQKAEDGE